MYEYGARAGFWRLHRLFTEANLPVTVYGVATALMRAPAQVAAMQDAGWEIASHGLKWVQHKDFTPAEERQQIAEAIRLHEIATGEKPRGWYTGRSSLNTVDLVDNGEEFFQFLRDSFDCLYAEGEAGAPKMMSIGLHCRLVGQPGRFQGLKKFVDYILSFDKVWVPTRLAIAEHWAAEHPYQGAEVHPSQLDKQEFVQRYGSIFEHSPWIAERAWDGEMGPANDTAIGLHFALRTQFRMATQEERLAVLRAHPDLAGKLAAAKRLTEESTAEQASAGLDHLTDEERETFTRLNTAYVEKFGFPFIIAVRDHDKASILENFEQRLGNTAEEEFRTAAAQVERIALLRLKAILP